MVGSESTSTYLVMTLPLYAQNRVDEEEDAELLRFGWPGETSLEPNRKREELLNLRFLWSQCSQRSYVRTPKFELIYKAFKLISLPRCTALRQSHGGRMKGFRKGRV